MTLSADGHMLVVANGGIETHPDFGRTKLNLDHMEPSLALIDTATGNLIERHAMPDTLRQLSTRHVDIDATGKIWFACQYEGARNDLPPLAGSFARGEDIRFLDLPEEVTLALANYIGAIAVNRRDGLVGLTSPKGGTAVTVDARTGLWCVRNNWPMRQGLPPQRTVSSPRPIQARSGRPAAGSPGTSISSGWASSDRAPSAVQERSDVVPEIGNLIVMPVVEPDAGGFHRLGTQPLIEFPVRIARQDPGKQ